MFIIWGDRASGHPAPDPSTAGRDVVAGGSRVYCLADMVTNAYAMMWGLGDGRKPA